MQKGLQSCVLYKRGYREIMPKQKEPTLFRVVLLDDKCFGNSYGDILNIKYEDDKYYYYYDGFKRWCYIEKEKCRILSRT